LTAASGLDNTNYWFVLETGHEPVQVSRQGGGGGWWRRRARRTWERDATRHAEVTLGGVRARGGVCPVSWSMVAGSQRNLWLGDGPAVGEGSASGPSTCPRPHPGHEPRPISPDRERVPDPRLADRVDGASGAVGSFFFEIPAAPIARSSWPGHRPSRRSGDQPSENPRVILGPRPSSSVQPAARAGVAAPGDDPCGTGSCALADTAFGLRAARPLDPARRRQLCASGLRDDAVLCDGPEGHRLHHHALWRPRRLDVASFTPARALIWPAYDHDLSPRPGGPGLPPCPATRPYEEIAGPHFTPEDQPQALAERIARLRPAPPPPPPSEAHGSGRPLPPLRPPPPSTDLFR